MPGFRCIAMPTETAIRFRETGRETGRDDRGGALLSRVADGPGGTYWTPSPVFLHARACPRFAAEDAIAPTLLANGIVSVRAYDDAEVCLYDLGQVSPGPEVAAPLLRALADPRTRFVNIHTARPGCWLAGAERLERRIAERLNEDRQHESGAEVRRIALCRAGGRGLG